MLDTLIHDIPFPAPVICLSFGDMFLLCPVLLLCPVSFPLTTATLLGRSIILRSPTHTTVLGGSIGLT